MHDARGPMPGMEVDVSKEGGGKDEKALLCFVPGYLEDYQTKSPTQRWSPNLVEIVLDEGCPRQTSWTSSVFPERNTG